MQKYFNNVANRAGVAVANATITVKTQAGAFADLFSDNGVTAKTNPVKTDSNGYFEFYAADGRYNFTIAGAGIGTQVINDVLIEDPADGTQSVSALTFQQAGAGGFFDSGTATEWRNLYDKTAATYIYPLAARVGVTVGASPFSFQNTTGQYVEVILQNGTITSMTRTRAGSTFLAPTITPNAVLLAPLESITITYSAAPLVSYLPHNGFQG